VSCCRRAVAFGAAVTDIRDRIALGQYAEALEVYGHVVRALVEHADVDA
jgi:hypothetical protein